MGELVAFLYEMCGVSVGSMGRAHTPFFPSVQLSWFPRRTKRIERWFRNSFFFLLVVYLFLWMVGWQAFKGTGRIECIIVFDFSQVITCLVSNIVLSTLHFWWMSILIK
ncbi:hypothetical protein QBC35DRAFT_280977 [Podospora australis]|uniref:Uncharacterized protein n=1 Tax=Podospora australis TaxID=1536484 RepID=A0AAN7AGX1_9PEZI|nr:hypothetical protein QBC35DRAFT_280977 [Podospora australis]